MSFLIEFNNIGKSFGNKAVLQNVNFTIRNNAYVALVGNNGSGKTTCINLLLNFLRPDKGKITYHGKNIYESEIEFKKNTGFILSEPYYISEFSVIEYLNFICRFQKILRNESSDKIDELLGFFDMLNMKKHKINHLSSGAQKKVSLISALIHNPSNLIFDEPLGNLDIKSIEQFGILLDTLKTRKTMFITSHNLDFISDICDEFIIIDKGKIIATYARHEYPNIQELKSAIKQNLMSKQAANGFTWLK